uniref:Uncharacterized protein n=1 Tax=Hyaloperonospora arabidopsidis (strain Emoy2) TaxID=559515 RepID=M4BPI7_HYAAE
MLLTGTFYLTSLSATVDCPAIQLLLITNKVSGYVVTTSVIYHDTVLLLLAFSFCWLKTSGVMAGHSQKGPWKPSVDQVPD